MYMYQIKKIDFTDGQPKSVSLDLNTTWDNLPIVEFTVPVDLTHHDVKLYTSKGKQISLKHISGTVYTLGPVMRWMTATSMTATLIAEDDEGRRKYVSPTLSVTATLPPSPTPGGTNDHTQLINRDAADQHPISSITGLNEAIEISKYS